ncbi:hypothetical protein ACEN2T_17390 [Pseudomonas sp. W22_MBD1_FP4]|uniref:hypothetical protein n=1 Tax=Pseudomonas sp. W22_MBD1_FP4 TaxID=3240272 RepID=UPI003F95036A
MASGKHELTEAQVQAAALPGESWEEARDRLLLEQLGQGEPSRSCVTMRPGYLQPPLKTNANCAQMDALRAFQQLSRREQFDYWLTIQGRSRPADILECPSLASLVAIGMEWNDCTARVPHEDKRGRLYYLVGVDYDTWLTCCRYTGWGWERKSDRSLISGVSHWRIAREDEQLSREATADEILTIRALLRL